MKLTYDKEADAAYLYFKPLSAGEAAKTIEGEGETEGINLDLDAEGRLVGIEILGASRRLPGECLRKAERL